MPLSHPISKSPRPRVALAVILLLFATSGLLLAFLLRDMDWELVRHTSALALALIFGLTVLGTSIYTLLVYLLVRGSGHAATLWKAYLVLTASLSANYITPVKIGIPLRVYLYNHFMGIPAATGTALVTVEALVGLLVPALTAIAGIVFLFPNLGLVAPLILIALLLAGLLLILCAPIKRLEPYLLKLPFSHLTKRLLRFTERVQSGLHHLSPVVILGVVALDLLMLGTQALRLWLVLRIFGPTPSPLVLLTVLTTSLTFGNLSMIPMGLGVRDASFTLLLVQLGLSQEMAFSAAIIQRLFAPGWPLILGLISTNILGIQLLGARQEAQERRPPPPLRQPSWAVAAWQRLRGALSPHEGRAVAILLLVTCLKGLIWSAALPLWEAPDEPTHFAPVQFIAEQGRLPGAGEIYQSEELFQSQLLVEHFAVALHPDRQMAFSDTEEGINESRTRSLPPALRTTPSDHPSAAMYLPPLPYVPGATVYRLAGSGDILTRGYAVRSVSICLTAATVLLAYLICRELFPDDPAMRLTVPVLVSFQPVFTAMGAVINSDMLLFFLCTVLTYLGARMLKRGITPGRAIWTGITLGLGILTKPLIWAAVPPLGLVWLWELWHRRERWKHALFGILLAILAASAIGGWWLIRSQRLNANPFYASPTNEVWGRSQGAREIGLQQFADFYVERLRTRILRTYWGHFGWDVYMPTTYLNPLRILLALAIAGLGLWGSQAIYRRRFNIGEQGMVYFAAWAFSILAMFAILGFILARRYGSTQPNHGRYFLGPVVAEMGLLAVGVTALFPRRLKFLAHSLLRFGMIAFNLLCLLGFVIPRYYG